MRKKERKILNLALNNQSKKLSFVKPKSKGLND